MLPDPVDSEQNATAQSRSQPTRIPRESTRQSDIRQAEPQHDDPLEPQTRPTVRRRPGPEAVHVLFDAGALRIDRRIHAPHASGQKVRVVDALRARQDLGAAHVEVEGVGIGCFGRVWGMRGEVLGRGHCVEGTDGEGVLVKDVEVCVVLFEDETAEQFLLRRAAKRALC